MLSCSSISGSGFLATIKRSHDKADGTARQGGGCFSWAVFVSWAVTPHDSAAPWSLLNAPVQVLVEGSRTEVDGTEEDSKRHKVIHDHLRVCVCT